MEEVKTKTEGGDARHLDFELGDPANSNTGAIDLNFPSQSTPVALPPIPWKVFALSIFLTVSGMVLIVLGFIDEIRKSDPIGGLSFWLTGALVCIPGVFYTVKLIIAWRSTDPEERMRILDDVPV